MRYQWLLGLSTAAALSVAVPAPAAAQSQANYNQALKAQALKWEMAYLALSAIDTVQTIECLDRGVCQEGNPLFGKNPSAKKIILGKLGLGLAHFALFSYANDRDPKAALRGAQISVGLQGAVVALNMRAAF